MMLPDNLMRLWMKLINGRRMVSDGCSVDLYGDYDPEELEQLRKLGYYQPIDETLGFVRIPF